MWGSVERGEEVDTASRLKKKHSLPIAVTTPKRGPLLLTSSEARGDGGSGRVRVRGGGERRGRIVGCGRQRMLQLPKKPAKHSLTRFPVAMVQRPLQEIEDDLGHLSCAVLQDTVHSVLLPAKTKKVMLPHLHPIMRYSPLNNGLHGNQEAPPPTERYIHSRREGNMGVSITYSRHSPLTLTSPPLDHAHSSNSQGTALGQSTRNTSTPSQTSPPSRVPHTVEPHQGPSVLPPASRPQGELQRHITNSYLHPLEGVGDWGREGSRPRALVCPPLTSSLAPASLQALVTHFRKPLTQQTTLRGRKIIL